MSSMSPVKNVYQDTMMNQSPDTFKNESPEFGKRNNSQTRPNGAKLYPYIEGEHNSTPALKPNNIVEKPSLDNQSQYSKKYSTFKEQNKQAGIAKGGLEAASKSIKDDLSSNSHVNL